ncbi:MAG: outer membrane beta-barrel domain-containing protein [Deltaproteobacteria bacterium]|nr:MAG: outer membrane beta-barrel domain-containing protein [Deltaproteobacteria bacterium]
MGSRAARDVALARRALRWGRCERPRHLGDAGAGDRQAGAARAHPRVAAARLPGRVRGHRPPLRQGGPARRCAGSFRDVPRRWPRRCLDGDRRDPWSAADDRRRNRAADLAGREHRDHRAGGRQPLRGARDGGRLSADESDGVLDGEARALLLLRRWTMKAVVAAALLVAAQARAADEAAPAEETKVAQITPAALPPVASVPRYGAPASLPPVTAQLFRLGGMLEVQPMFAFSIGDPFWRTLGMGVRVEHHFDERWSISGHAIGGISLLAAPVEVCSDTCNSPAEGKLRSTPGKLQLVSGIQVGWAPVYGKLSLMGERTLHFDFYVAAGPELVREMIAPDAASPERGRWAAGGRVSIGERLFLTDRFMIRFAASELIYAGRVRGVAEIERKLIIEGGVGWLFGGGR